MVFVTDNNFIGFEVGDVTTGAVIASVPATGFTCNCQSYDSPSHGISLSPDEKEIYIPDRFNGDVHVFDVSHLPSQMPSHLADIKLTHPLTGTIPSPCTIDCSREGWALHSRDGRFVYIGDSSDVIDTTTRTVIASLPVLNSSRIYAEIDWQNGIPVFTTDRYGVGYAGASSTNPTPSNNPSGTNISISICPHGLNMCGDNTNPNGKGNTNPKHSTRLATLTILDGNSNEVARQSGNIMNTQSSGLFSGTINITNLQTGSYFLKIHIDGFLTKLLPGVTSITSGQTITIPLISFINGDIDNNNQLDILYYNALVNCFGSKQTTSTCKSGPTQQVTGADIDDTGSIDGVDYNLFLRELSVQSGS